MAVEKGGSGAATAVIAAKMLEQYFGIEPRTDAADQTAQPPPLPIRRCRMPLPLRTAQLRRMRIQRIQRLRTTIPRPLMRVMNMREKKMDDMNESDVFDPGTFAVRHPMAAVRTGRRCA